MHILMSKPSMTEAELLAVKEILDSGWLGEGASSEKFENKIADFTGAPYVVGVNTGTSALHLILVEMGVGPGDEVILPSFTFASDPMAVHLCGARPVFADVELQSLNLDPAQLEALITPRTRVIMPTDYAGLPADVPAIRKVIGKRDIRIVRDASHSFGSSINGRPLGVWCGEDATCFSFDPIKTITCGEGGAILVNNQEWATNMMCKRRLGFEQSIWSSLTGGAVQDRRVSQVGYRYHLSNINAAIGLVQIKRLPELIRNRREVAIRYNELLADISGIKIFLRDYSQVTPFIYPVLADGSHRDKLVDWLNSRGIHAGLRYFPSHRQPFFDAPDLVLPVTDRIARELICLPIHAELSRKDIDEVVGEIRSYFESAPALEVASVKT